MKSIKTILQLLIFVIFVSCSNAGTDNSDSIHIATFNVEWLGDGIDDTKPRTQEDYARMADVILATKAEVIGLQEVENETAMKYLLQFLPEFDYYIANDDYRQRNAVLIKKTVTVLEHKNFNDLIVKENRTRPGLLLNLKKNNFDFNLMVVHFKSTSRFDSTDEMKFESYELRYKQALVLDKWVENTLNTSNEKDLIIMGDFNDNPKNKKPRGNLDALIENTNISFLTTDLTSCKNAKWNVIDHIIISNSVKNRYFENSVHLYDTYSAYTHDEVKLISDHCPVIATFDTKMPDND